MVYCAVLVNALDACRVKTDVVPLAIALLTVPVLEIPEYATGLPSMVALDMVTVAAPVFWTLTATDVVFT